MRILAVHANYQVRGGEDVSHESEIELLANAGNEVFDFRASNADFGKQPIHSQFVRQAYNVEALRELRGIATKFQPDVVYVNNLFPAISPSIFRLKVPAGVPIVRVVRNYRRECIAASLRRGDRDCAKCCGKLMAWPGVIHACYRESRLASAAVTVGKLVDNTLKLEDKGVDATICVSNFVRDYLLRSGLRPSSLFVRPNLVYPERLPITGTDAASRPKVALFVGRGSRDKGIDDYLEIASRLAAPNRIFKLAGTIDPGAIKPDDPRLTSVEMMGTLSREQIHAVMCAADVVVVPSRWHEPFGRVVVEALSAGTPVVATDVGGMTDFAGEGVTLVWAGAVDRMVAEVEGIFQLNQSAMLLLRAAARARYVRDFGAETWVDRTIDIFDAARSSSRARGRRT